MSSHDGSHKPVLPRVVSTFCVGRYASDELLRIRPQKMRRPNKWPHIINNDLATT